MSIRKYSARNMSEGLRQIQEELGPDALIVKTAKRNGKVEFFVEFESATKISSTGKPEMPVVSDPVIQEEYRQAKLRMLTAVADKTSTAPGSGTSETPSVQVPPVKTNPVAVTAFDSILGNVQGSKKRERTVASLIQGLQLDIQVAARVRDVKRLDELVHNLGLLVRPCEGPRRQGIKAFVGPAGSGKTTTLIKLITQQVMRSGPSSCAIINCDRYRAGARELLERLGNLLDVQVLHINSKLSLNQALGKVTSREFVAIDTPGLGMSDTQLSSELFQLSSSNFDISRYLVLPVNLQTAVMCMAEEVYHEAGQTSCIMTRLDDCCSLGPALSFLIRQQLPLAYTTNGPHIPQDLSTASGPDFVDHALRKMEASEREADRLQQMDQEVFTGQFSATQFSSNYSASSEQVAKKAMSDLTDMKHRKEVALNMVMDI